MRKKGLPALALALMLFTTAATPASAAFTDAAGHWAEAAITKWSEGYGIINGYDDGTFRPDDSITRGAFAGILDRFLHFTAVSPASTFSDTAGTYWESEILKLHAAGVYLGNEGRALAGDTISRQQAVTMIARAFQIEASTLSLPYGDAGQIAEYAQGPVAEMTARGYITDSADGNFRPLEGITRAEIVNILNNMIEVLVQTAEPFTGSVEGTVLINSVEGATLTEMEIAGDLILAPGVAGTVTLDDVEISGSIRNFSAVTPVRGDGTQADPGVEPPEEPASAIPPSAIYTPTPTTGETIAYSSYRVPVYAQGEKSLLGEGDFAWNGNRLTYVGGDFTTRFGVDVSAYQNRASANETIDWQAVAGDGVEFAFVRVGGRGTSSGEMYADAYYAKNIDGAMAAGIETGVYFFAQAITVEEAIAEAEFVLQKLEGHTINGPVAYDWEMGDSTYRVYGTTPEMATACALAFCQRIEEAGYDAMIYAGNYVGYIKYDQGAVEQYPRWYAAYVTQESTVLYPTFYYQPDYWQYSSKASVAGIGGNVDVNIQFLR